MAAAAGDRPHLPRLVPIDGYGSGGFRLGDLSHRGSLLCLPSGVWAWGVTKTAELDAEALAPVFAEADGIGIFLLGTGNERWALPDALFDRFHALKINVEVARTGTAVSTYNILLGEGRRVAAGLIAVR